MLRPRLEKPRKRPTRAKLNTSSRTKTRRSDRKKDKKPISVKQVQAKIESLIGSDDLLLPKLFDVAAIEAILAEQDKPDQPQRRARVYTIPMTLNLFMQQVLVKDRGCKEVVTLLNQLRKNDNLPEVSTNTTSYCDARARIPLFLIKTLVARTAKLVSDKLTEEDLWFERRVLLVDGFVVNAPDTPENQVAYPQSKSQKAGLGFPQVRGCVSICLASGVINDIQYGPTVGKKTGEATLFRQMFVNYKRGDIVVADSNFESYRDLATLKRKGVDMICDKNGSRESPFQGRCKILEETTKELPRPDFDKSRFTQSEWETLPATLSVRIIRCKIGGRKKELTLVTTLLDRNAYPAREIVKLYKHRWECELDIRSIKSVMGMNWLSCHTPEMLERELMVYILAYNIIRMTMYDSAKIVGERARDLSFKNAKDSWIAFGKAGNDSRSYAWLVWAIVQAPLRKRPGRQEPRKIKRRNSKYEHLKVPRAQENATLAA